MEPEIDETTSNASEETVGASLTNEIHKHAVATLTRMNELRKKGNLCDVLVKVGDRDFPAHKVVLAASSDYFDAMFSSGMAEAAQSIVELKCISGEVMEALLDFMYTGHVRVSMTNVQELLPAASLIQMEGVRSACSSFLYQEVEPGNVLGIRRFAELHNCVQLEAFAKNYAAHNFEIVADYDEFLYLGLDELVDFISREDLHIDSEETVYKAVTKWVYHEPDTREVHLSQLLRQVRLAVMSARFLTDIVDKESLIRNSLECRDLVDDAKRFHLRPDLRHEMRDKRFRQRNGADEYLVVIGGFGADQSPSDSVEMFNPRSHEWTELPSLPLRYRYVAACALSTCVYVIGGYDGRERLNTVGLLDITQREEGWKWVASMHFKRGLAAACTHKGLIYVCGGFDGQTRLRSLEVYHPKIDEWRLLEEMTTPREGAGLVVADDNLYCLGGYDGLTLLSSMERYDPRRGTWSCCEPMYMRRSGAGCSVIGDTLYVCGGYGGAESLGPLHLDSVEAYNTRLGQWTLVVSMHVARCYVGACQMAGKIYVAAGYDGCRLLDTVECFDPTENTWTLHEESRMKHERCDTGMCVVRFLEYAEVITHGNSTTTSCMAVNPPCTATVAPLLPPMSSVLATGSPAVDSVTGAASGGPSGLSPFTGSMSSRTGHTSASVQPHLANVVAPFDEARGGPQQASPSPAAPGGVSGPASSTPSSLVSARMVYSSTSSLSATNQSQVVQSSTNSVLPRVGIVMSSTSASTSTSSTPGILGTSTSASNRQSVAMVAPVIGRSVSSHYQQQRNHQRGGSTSHHSVTSLPTHASHAQVLPSQHTSSVATVGMAAATVAPLIVTNSLPISSSHVTSSQQVSVLDQDVMNLEEDDQASGSAFSSIVLPFESDTVQSLEPNGISLSMLSLEETNEIAADSNSETDEGAGS